jgi:hypothetical protein
MNPRLKFAAPAAFLIALVLAPIGLATATAAPMRPADPSPPASGLHGEAARLLQAQVDRQLAAHGGVQVSPYEISYGDRATDGPIMVFADPSTGKFPTDPANRVEATTGTTGTTAVMPGASTAQSLMTTTTLYRYGCPYSGWTCFYQDSNFNGYTCVSGPTSCSSGARMLEFQSCGWQSLATYGFSDQTSSWVNDTSSYVSVYDGSGSQLWSEAPGALSSYVGDANNDRADNFWIVC